MPIHFHNPEVLWGLWLVPFAVGLFAYAVARRREALAAFGSPRLPLHRRREAVGTCLAIAALVLALARPAWNRQRQEVRETGRDVVFLLDVSRSMLAEDMHPNRLESAKSAILDCVDGLGGDHIGLVLFAGSAEVRCPLTTDYEYFRMALRQATPESVAAGGTMVNHAIERTAEKLLSPQKSGMQDIILITDGEDTGKDIDTAEAARALEKAGARLVIVGIGDRLRGSRIALESEGGEGRSFMRHDQREVWSRLHSEALRKLAESVPDGIYFEVGTGPFDLRKIYRQVMEHAQRNPSEVRRIERYRERFPLFLAIAIAALLLSSGNLNSRRGRRGPSSPVPIKP